MSRPAAAAAGCSAVLLAHASEPVMMSSVDRTTNNRFIELVSLLVERSVFLVKAVGLLHSIPSLGRGAAHAFSDPIMTPLAKYFWMNGYTISIGSIAAISVACLSFS